MISELFRKWFGLDPIHCETCDLLRERLASSESERRELLHRLLEKDKPEPLSKEKEEDLVPIKPQFTPWRVRQQLLEAEDRKKKQLLDESIKNLEGELGVRQ